MGRDRRYYFKSGVNMSFISKLVNFSKAATDHLLSGLENSTDEVKEQRASICNRCPFIDKENYKCIHCGCYLKYKIAWSTSSCPIGKW